LKGSRQSGSAEHLGDAPETSAANYCGESDRSNEISVDARPDARLGHERNNENPQRPNCRERHRSVKRWSRQTPEHHEGQRSHYAHENDLGCLLGGMTHDDESRIRGSRRRIKTKTFSALARAPSIARPAELRQKPEGGNQH
jgi:hypothetical protein